MLAGDALADVADTVWARGEITRLKEMRIVCTDEWLEALLRVGRHAEVVGAAERAVATDPSRERLWAHLMVALYRCGRQAEALRAFQRLRGHLGEELGIEPTMELRTLEEAILLQEPELDWQEPPNLPPRRPERPAGQGPGTLAPLSLVLKR